MPIEQNKPASHTAVPPEASSQTPEQPSVGKFNHTDVTKHDTTPQLHTDDSLAQAKQQWPMVYYLQRLKDHTLATVSKSREVLSGILKSGKVSESQQAQTKLIPIAFSNYGITAHFLEHKLRNRPASLRSLFHASQQMLTISS